ncbi:uncharacterized protein LOC128853626 [Cuculus canorus]|uniref:uncharacterized protein LOC128853626 n=1 Tax=Cuculus canorus TaxID=55661 RepID=UPI0023AB0882|nr:uncharacterized protein LOC128853626 [Cuculus canorus]
MVSASLGVYTFHGIGPNCRHICQGRFDRRHGLQFHGSKAEEHGEGCESSSVVAAALASSARFCVWCGKNGDRRVNGAGSQCCLLLAAARYCNTGVAQGRWSHRSGGCVKVALPAAVVSASPVFLTSPHVPAAPCCSAPLGFRLEQYHSPGPRVTATWRRQDRRLRRRRAPPRRVPGRLYGRRSAGWGYGRVRVVLRMGIGRCPLSAGDWSVAAAAPLMHGRNGARLGLTVEEEGDHGKMEAVDIQPEKPVWRVSLLQKIWQKSCGTALLFQSLVFFCLLSRHKGYRWVLWHGMGGRRRMNFTCSSLAK